MSRLHPIPYGAGVLLVPDWCNPLPAKRVVRPTRVQKDSRNACI